MGKRALVFASLVFIATLFQNCGDGFKPIAPESLSAASVSVPLDGTVNAPGGPVILTGLQGKTVFDSAGGLQLEVTLQNTSGVLYRWTVNGTTISTAEPKHVIKNPGKYDVKFEAFDNLGHVSATRAEFVVSSYTKNATELLYAGIAVANVDIATVIPLGRYYAADKNRVFRSTSSLVTAGSLAAKEIDSNYLSVNGFGYFDLKPIVGMIGADLTVLSNQGLAHDKRKVFCKTDELPGADPATFAFPFKTAINFAIDADEVFFNCAAAPGISRAGFAPIVNANTGAQGSSGFFKAGGKYYFLNGSTSLPNASTLSRVVELPFASVNEAQLRLFKQGTIDFVANGTEYAVLSGGSLKTVTGVNVPALQQLGGAGSTVFKDTAQVFEYKSGVFTPVANANPATFTVVGGAGTTAFKDATRVWLNSASAGLREITTADAATFVFLGATGRGAMFADKFGAYVGDMSALWPLQVSGASGLTAIPSTYFVKDGTRLFYLPYHAPAQLVPGHTPGAVKVHMVNMIGSGTALIYNNRVVSGARGDLLVKIDQSNYWKDATTLYNVSIFDIVPLSTRLASFRFFDQNVSDEYATDGVTVWYEEKAIVSAELATFKVNSLRTAEDRLRTYSYERATLK